MDHSRHGVLPEGSAGRQLVEGIEAVLQQLDVVELLLGDHRQLDGEAGGGGGRQVVQLVHSGQAGQEAGQGGRDLHVGGRGVLGVDVGQGGEVVWREHVVQRQLVGRTRPAHNLQMFVIFPIVRRPSSYLLVLQLLVTLVLHVNPVVVTGNDFNILRVSSLQLRVHVDELVVPVLLLITVLTGYSFTVNTLDALLSEEGTDLILFWWKVRGQ